MSTYTDALAFIVTASEQEAEKLNQACIDRIKWHRHIRNMNVGATLVRGTKVWWKTEKHGLPRIMKGTVKQVNTSTAKILTDGNEIWRVELSLLEVGS